jgi:hypothetical protein
MLENFRSAWLALGPLDLLLTPLSLVLHLLLFLLLIRRRLVADFPWLAAYAGFEFSRELALFLLDRKTELFFEIYTATEVAVWCIYFGMTVELYRRVFRDYAGIAILGPSTAILAVLGAFLVSMLGAIHQPDFSTEKFPYVLVLTLSSHVVYATMLLFLLALLVFMARYPIRLSPNVLWYACGFAFFFLALTAMSYLRNTQGAAATQVASAVGTGGVNVVMLGWVWSLREAGRAVPQRIHPADPETQRRLLAQLEAINGVAVSVVRRSRL